MRAPWVAALGVSAILLTGCGELLSIEPLATKSNTVFDPALLGVWTDGEDLILRVTEYKPAAYDILWTNTKDSEKVELKAKLVSLGDQRILDLWPADPVPFSIPGHAFIAISVTGEGIEARFLDTKWLRAKVRQSDSLAHINIEGDPLITAPTAQVGTFLLEFAPSPEAQDDPIRLRRAKR